MLNEPLLAFLKAILVVSLMNRMFAFNDDLCYIQNTPQVLVWQNV